jgi:hypothetical protein
VNLFKPKTQKASSTKSVELTFDHNEKNALAFGLQWRSLVTSDARAMGVKMARAQGATHFLFRGQQIGFGVIDVKYDLHLAGGTSIFPAAQVAARMFGGDGIFVLRVAEGEYWLALIRNGSPTSSDAFLQNSNDHEALSFAQAQVADISGEKASVVVYTNIENTGLPGTIRYTSVEDILAGASNNEDRLQPMSKKGMSIPVPVMVVALLCLVVLVGKAGLDWWANKKRMQLAAQNRVAKEDPAVTWARAIAAWEATKVLPNVQGLVAARESIGLLPVIWGGWTLGVAKCTAAPLDTPAKVRAWSCVATYERLNSSSKYNREMAPAIPKGWSVVFTPLKTMQVSWSLQEAVAPLLVANLKPTNFHIVETGSVFQSLLPALASDMSFAFAPAVIPVPLDAEGQALTPNDVAASLREAAINIRAPMRSIDYIADRSIPVDWTSIEISVGAGSNPNLKASVVNAEISGVIYAKN